ncbi:hypothetical protein MA16_Dca011730 [Dendrobium catenatum]|uniref:Uncharacterized protein n=1 Tax=Dendrobium catenatum TaxID=906689 RepID=A0A2I0WY82_9ASPA|nr:hypothetical protein MA16_Dca011730 [Dendrobium catenatum]
MEPSVAPTKRQFLRLFIADEQCDVNICVALFICGAIFWSLSNLSKKHVKEENDRYGAKWNSIGDESRHFFSFITF